MGRRREFAADEQFQLAYGGRPRRKIDVDRMLTEDVRGVMAEEARRTIMVSSIQGLQASLGRKGANPGGGRAPRKATT